jgi:hypothetical protein
MKRLGLVIMAGMLLGSAVLAHAESIKEACRYEARIVSQTAAMVTIGKGSEMKRAITTLKEANTPYGRRMKARALATLADFERTGAPSADEVGKFMEAREQECLAAEQGR